MQSFVRLVSLAAIIALAWTGGICSDKIADKLTVVLEGQGVNEVAPHGGGNVYAPDVMWDGGIFKMWYGGQGKDGHDRISYAESLDGMTWNRQGVVLSDDTANHINDPSVVKVDGRFYMFYTRAEKDVVDRIDVAVSTDGKKWTPKGVAVAAGPAGTWDALSVGRPSVIFDDGLFKMWYDGRKDFPPGSPVNGVPTSSTSHRSVGYATSKDGLKWTRYHNNPVFGNNAGAVDVKRWENGFIMLYESGDGTRFSRSTDGIDWKDGGVFVKKSGTQIDAFGHVTPLLLLDADKKKHRLFVGAAGATTWDHNRIAVIEISEERLNQIFGEAEK